MATFQRAACLCYRQRPSIRGFVSSGYRDPSKATFNSEDLRVLNSEVEGLFGPLGDPDYDCEPPARNDGANPVVNGGMGKIGGAAPLDNPSKSHLPTYTTPAADIGALKQESSRTRGIGRLETNPPRHSRSESPVDGILSHHKEALEAQLIEVLSLHLSDSEEKTRVALTKDIQLLVENNHRQVTAALGTEMRLQEIRWRRADF